MVSVRYDIFVCVIYNLGPLSLSPFNNYICKLPPTGELQKYGRWVKLVDDEQEHNKLVIRFNLIIRLTFCHLLHHRHGA